MCLKKGIFVQLPIETPPKKGSFGQHTHFLKYHLENEILISRGKLDEKEEELKNYGFFRIYKCYLVNLSYVDKVTVNSVFIGKEELLISRFRKKNFLAALKDHVSDFI